MSDPTPLTDDELAHARQALSANSPWTIARRALATVDAERARADQLNTQADAMTEYLRDSLERLALTAGVPIEDDGGPRANFYLVDDVEQAITDLLQAVLSEGLTADGFRRKYLDASPTEGNPDE